MMPMFIFPGVPSFDGIVQKGRGFLADMIGWIFDDMLKYVLFTPFEMFKSVAVVSIVIKMGIVSGGLVTILALIEGLKRTLSLSYTPMRTILMRYPIALAVSGFAPILFYYAGMGVNEMVSLIGKLADVNIGGDAIYMNKWHQLGGSIFESFMTFFFLIALFFYLMKAFLYHGARWFGLILNCVTTPVVMLSYVFKTYDHVARGWLKDTLSKYGMQVVHSLFLSLIAVILYTPNLLPPDGGLAAFNSFLVRLMLSVGGLHMMMNPPAWLKNAISNAGTDPKSMMQSVGKIISLVSKLKGG